jgi:hypothetical protein
VNPIEIKKTAGIPFLTAVRVVGTGSIPKEGDPKKLINRFVKQTFTNCFIDSSIK